MSANDQRGRALTGRRHPPASGLRRSLASVALALALSTFLPVSVAIQDLPGAADLQAALPEPLKTLTAFARDPHFIEEAGAASAPGDAPPLYIRDASGHIPADRGGRVGPTRLDPVQPHFAAGRLMAPAGLLRPGIALGDAEMRTALAGPQPVGGSILVAQNFRIPGALRASEDALPVQVASLDRSGGMAEAAVRVSIGGQSGLAELAAYAPAQNPETPSLFDAVLGRKTAGGFVPPIGAKDHSWAATTLPASSFTQKEQTCLATGIYFEARGETELGQAAVAQVILNRVRNPTYPKTICGVVYQNQAWKNRCQFSFACDGIKDVIWNKRAYGTAKRIAQEVTQGETWLPEVGSATHYHAAYVHPRWAKSMEKVDKIGLHIFYRTFNGGWN